MYILKHVLVPRPRLKIFLNFLRGGLDYCRLRKIILRARAHGHMGAACITRMRKVLKVT